MCVSCACNGVRGAENKNNANAKGRERKTQREREKCVFRGMFWGKKKKVFVGGILKILTKREKIHSFFTHFSLNLLHPSERERHPPPPLTTREKKNDTNEAHR